MNEQSRRYWESPNPKIFNSLGTDESYEFKEVAYKPGEPVTVPKGWESAIKVFIGEESVLYRRDKLKPGVASLFNEQNTFLGE